MLVTRLCFFFLELEVLKNSWILESFEELFSQLRALTLKTWQH